MFFSLYKADVSREKKGGLQGRELGLKTAHHLDLAPVMQGVLCFKLG